MGRARPSRSEGWRASADASRCNTSRWTNMTPFVIADLPDYVSAIHLARVYAERKRSFVGQHFWARGYFVSTVGRDEAVIREYIKHQEQEDMRLEQMRLWSW